MRQVVKDRIARLDAQVVELQEMYRTKYGLENDPVTGHLHSPNLGTKTIERKIGALIEKREIIINQALFPPVGQNTYQLGLSDRMSNYDSALEEQATYMDGITEAITAGDLDSAKRYRTKLGNCNRIVAIYKKALDTWIAKGDRVVADRPRTQAAYREEKKILRENMPEDKEIVGYINQNYLGGSSKPKITNSANIAMLTRPSVEHPRDACAWALPIAQTVNDE